MAHHPWPIGWAPPNIAKLLLDQRTDTVLVAAMMPMVVVQILAPHDLRLMGATLVALVGDPIVRRENAQHRRRSESRRGQRTTRARHACLPFAHAAPLAEW